MIRVPSLVLSLGCAALFVCAATAEPFPAKPVTLIVPWPAGGSTDVQLRALAGATEKHLGQRIVIENRPGASGSLAPIHMAARERSDGYVVSQIPISVFRSALTGQTAFDPARDLTYILRVSAYTFGIVVRADAPWKTFDALIEYAKANPGKLNYATSGVGGTPHLTMEQIARRSGIQWTHVPYKGVAESVAAVMGGHVQLTADGSGWAPQVNSGDLRLLVTWGEQRSRTWPQVPTLREAGIDIVATSPYGIAGPKGMDPAVVKILHDAFKKGLEEPSHQAVMSGLDQDAAYLNSGDYRRSVLEFIEDEKAINMQLGLKRN